MTPVERSLGQTHYTLRLMIQDAFIVLAPSLLFLIGILWLYRREWSLLGLAQELASLLPFY